MKRVSSADQLNSNKIKMFNITKIYPRDIIAIVVLIACFILMALKINSLVTGLIILVVTFYFARRTDGEGVPEKDINHKVKKLEDEFNEMPKVQKAYFNTPNKPIIKQFPLTTGDFKPLILQE